MSWSSLLAQKLRPDENGNLPRLWFLLGSEPLLAIEAQDAIRDAAFKAGYSERKSFVFEGNADYSPLYEALGDQSLFGEKNLIEVVFPRATIGKNGPAAVEAVIEHADEDKMVVVSLFDYDWTATKKDWFNHLMKSSVCIRTDPIDRNALPRWITERAKEKNGQTLTPEAANLIAERTEGFWRRLRKFRNSPCSSTSRKLMSAMCSTPFPTFLVLIRNRYFLRCLKAMPDRCPKLSIPCKGKTFKFLLFSGC